MESFDSDHYPQNLILMHEDHGAWPGFHMQLFITYGMDVHTCPVENILKPTDVFPINTVITALKITVQTKNQTVTFCSKMVKAHNVKVYTFNHSGHDL